MLYENVYMYVCVHKHMCINICVKPAHVLWTIIWFMLRIRSVVQRFWVSELRILWVKVQWLMAILGNKSTVRCVGSAELGRVRLFDFYELQIASCKIDYVINIFCYI